MPEAKTEHFPISLIVFRFLSGFGAGLVGTIVWGLILFLSWSIVGDVLSPSDVQTNEFGIKLSVPKMHPLFIYIVIFAVFLATLAASIAYVFIFSTLEERYVAKATAITHVFFAGLLFVFLMIPVYIVAAKLWGPVGIAASAMLHAVILALFTFFVLEIIRNTKHLLVHLYGAVLALVLFFFFGTMLTKGTPAIVSFLTLPFLLGMFGTGNGVAEAVYHWFYQSYGNDVLNSERLFGADYAEEDEEPIDPDL